MKHTIISLSSDNPHTGTLDELINFVNNHPDCRAKDYSYDDMPRNYETYNNKFIKRWDDNPHTGTPNFQSRLEHLGYSFDVCGRAIKGTK